ncbi:hypothetical protein Ddye_010951 [Dipteronia dyeriana]|uniref:MULE transposase domain-containing protein n=1 Tax=Dipteronia dyeriana TaxID=168575 RepID=A0AAD9XEC0_9ROSI|nr:hypothetical protein Ddye_010951 [Dipteronia dyeriana]
MPNTNAHLDDIRKGYTETANNGNSSHRHFGFHDTTENETVSAHDVSEPQFDPIPDQVPNWSDNQFTHIQRLVLPPSIKRFDHEHTCSNEARFLHQRQASARVIGEHIKEKFRDHRLYKPKEIIQDIHNEFGISYNYHKGYRAKHIALDEVQGTPVESYQILPSYLYMLERTNPGTITDLHTDSANRFMKNGIITGVEKVFPNSFHGACVVHLERNMLGRYGKNNVLKDIFKKAIKVYQANQFTRCMEQLENINFEVAIYITDVEFERCAGAYSLRKRYNLTSSNIAEDMNNAIKACRELSITGVIDYIRGVLQRWFYDRQTSAGKLKSTLTTKADVNICVKGEKARYLTVYPITYY